MKFDVAGGHVLSVRQDFQVRIEFSSDADSVAPATTRASDHTPATYTFRSVSVTVHTVETPASTRTTEPGASVIAGRPSANSTVARP